MESLEIGARRLDLCEFPVPGYVRRRRRSGGIGLALGTAGNRWNRRAGEGEEERIQ